MTKRPFPLAAVIHHYLEKWARAEWAPHRHFQADTSEPLAHRFSRIQKLYNAAHASNPDYLAHLFMRVADEAKPPPPLRAAFIDAVIQLALDNDICFALPDAPSATLQFSEQQELTTKLLDVEHRLAHESAILRHFNYGAALLITGMTSEDIPLLPDAAKSPMHIPLISLLCNPKECIQKLLVTFIDDLNGDPPKHFAFAATREQLFKNLLAASGLTNEQARATPHRVVLPEASDLAPRECARVYLAHTPFVPLLEKHVPFAIPRRAYNEHGAVFARSGHGKTQTLRTIIHSFLQEDDPPALFVMDSLGSLIDGIDRLDVFSGRLRDRLVIIDPSDETPPALNFFKLQSDDLYFYLFKAIDQSFTPRQATMISYLMELMQHVEGATLHTLIEVCEAKHNLFPDAIEKLSAFAQSFFGNQFYATKPDQLVQQTKNQIANRLYTLGRLPKFDQMFSAAENKFDPYRCMQEKKIVLINTDGRPPRQGGLGEAFSVLGRFLLAQILDAARARPKDKRHLALIIVDEAKHYMDEQAALILSDARQYGLGMLLATQFPHQLEEGVRREINTNTSIKLMGPVEYAVAAQYARDMFTTPEFIMSMKSDPPHSAEWTCHVTNVTHAAVRLTVPFLALEKEPRMSTEAHRNLRSENRVRYGASRVASPAATISHKPVEMKKEKPKETPPNIRKPPSGDNSLIEFDTDH